MEVLKTNKNDRCFSIDGFLYKCDKKTKLLEGGTKFYCHCDQIFEGCKGRVIVQIFSDGQESVRITRDHNGHAERLKDLHSMRFRSEVKEKARVEPEKSSREVYDEVIASTISQVPQESIDELVSALPDLVQIKSSIQRARMEGRPALPESLDQLQIDGEWAKTLNGDRSLLFETFGAEKILGFATDSMLDYLCKSPFLIMDGTFRVSPSLFSQLYTLHGQYRGGIFCFMYLLLPNKRKETYEEALRLIKDSARRYGKVFNPMKFILDFENAMILALRSQFPSASIKGCLFHFTKAIWRNCQKIGLASHYAKDQLVRKFIKGLMALPFVPTDDLQAALDILRSDLPHANSDVRPLLDQLECYFFHTWVRGDFSPTIWNCYHSFSFRTTNHVEGWHRKFNSKIKIAHPTIFKFLRHLQEEERSVATRMLLLDNGHRLQPMLKKYRDLNSRIAIWTFELDTHERTLESYIRAISNSISDPTVIARHVTE